MPIDHDEMRPNLTKFSTLLHNFAQSKETFRIVTSISKIPSSNTTYPPPTTLYVLDSSFNPPTLAHLHIAISAFQTTSSTSIPFPSRLLLLLATQNADKAPKPASFEQRLAMMTIFAQDLLNQYNKNSPEKEEMSVPAIDIGITKLPYFIDKATSISSSQTYPSEPQQIHLIGFDTLTRLFSTKYYPPDHTLAPLMPFLNTHKLRVTLRPNDSWGDRSAQEEYVKGIGTGSLDDIGGKREWSEKIDAVDGMGEVVSSTKVREMARKGDESGLKGLLTEGVADWILKEKLYSEE